MVLWLKVLEKEGMRLEIRVIRNLYGIDFRAQAEKVCNRQLIVSYL